MNCPCRKPAISAFASLDRFRNPHLQHQWLSITMQYTSKLKSRVIPVLIRHYEKQDTPPPHMTLGFAAISCFMRAQPPHPVNDDKAKHFADLWQQHTPEKVVYHSLRDQGLWGVDLTLLPGFEAAVIDYLDSLINKGPVATLARITVKPVL